MGDGPWRGMLMYTYSGTYGETLDSHWRLATEQGLLNGQNFPETFYEVRTRKTM